MMRIYLAFLGEYYIRRLEREKSRRLRYLFTSGKNYQISRINLFLTSISIKSVMNNGSPWADIFLVRNGADPDLSSSKFDPTRSIMLGNVRSAYFLSLG